MVDTYWMTMFRWDELSVLGQRGETENPGSDLSHWVLKAGLSGQEQAGVDGGEL